MPYASVCPKSFNGLGLGGGGAEWLPSRPSRGSGTEEKILRSDEYRSSKRWACVLAWFDGPKSGSDPTKRSFLGEISKVL